MSNTYKPTWVANSFIEKARNEGQNLSPMKLQKLVYCLHGWNLAVREAPVVGEPFEAWPYGPVISSLYHAFKQFRSGDIQGFAEDCGPDTSAHAAYVVSKSRTDFYKMLDAVWERYKKYNGIQLSAMTHAPGTPWSKARERGDPYLNDKEIMSHFQKLARAT